ncbi:MAG: aminotransferase class I and II, partial [Pseudoxanthomonas sp.]
SQADATLSALLDRSVLHDLVPQVPDAWLLGPDAFADPPAQRAAYVDYLVRRLDQRQAFVQEAIDARR